MRLFVRRRSAERRQDRWRNARFGVEPLDFCADVEIALCTQEKTVARTTNTTHKTNPVVKFRFRCAGGKPKIAAPALGVEPRRHRDRLEQGRLAASVLTNQERDLRVQLNLVDERLDCRQGEWVLVRVFHALLNQI